MKNGLRNVIIENVKKRETEGYETMQTKFQKAHTGKYLKFIYLWTSIFFIAAQIVFSTAILIQTNQQDMRNNYEMNEQIFRQVAYNVNQADETVRNLCESLFVNPRISRIMYGTMQDDDIYDWIMEFQSICEPILVSNSQIQSVYIYNRGMDQLFSSYRYLSYEDEDLRRMLDNNEELPLMKPIIRNIYDPNSKTQTSKVITYILYDAMDDTEKPQGAVIVNVDFELFMGEIRQLLTFSEEEESKVFLYQNNELTDLDGKIQTDTEIEKTVQSMASEQQFDSEQKFLLETRQISGEKYGIFFMNIPRLDWTAIKLQSYDDVFSNVNHQKMVIVIASVAFCAVMLMLIYFLSRKIYSPIGQLVEKVREREKDGPTDIGDIEYLNHAYENLFLLAGEQKKQRTQEKILLTYHLRTLFIDGDKIEENIWNSLHSMNPELFQKDNLFGVGILRIDNYRKFQETYDYKNQELYRFVIENIFTELLENHGYCSVMVRVEEDKMAVLLHSEQSGETYRQDMADCFRQTNEYLYKFARLSFSMSFSAYRQGIEILPKLYYSADSMLSYRYVLGKEALIFDDYKGEAVETENSDVLMRQLNDHIQKGKKDKIPEDFEALTRLVKAQERDGLVQFIAGIAINILHMIDKQEKENKGYAGNVFIDRYTELLSMETWEEISETLQEKIEEVLSANDKQTQKSKLLVDAIVNIVQEEFANPNLCLAQISEMVNMSAQYVGRVFKGATGSSVSEYINEYRLNKSIEIMLETGCTVKEVLGQVGIENEGQYYRLFKKKYGDTPKVYMMKQRTGKGENK